MPWASLSLQMRIISDGPVACMKLQSGRQSTPALDPGSLGKHEIALSITDDKK